MIDITIQFEEEERILLAFGVETAEEVKKLFIKQVNERVNDYERGKAMSATIEAYQFRPLIEKGDTAL